MTIDSEPGALARILDALARLGVDVGPVADLDELAVALEAVSRNRNGNGNGGRKGDPDEYGYTAGRGANMSHTVTGRRGETIGLGAGRRSRPTRGEAAVIAEQTKLAKQYSAK